MTGQAPPGIVCALATPFDAGGAVDAKALAELVDFQVAQGVQGLFPLGTTGEGMLLDASERRRAAELVVERVRGRVPVVLHCGATDTATTAALAHHAEGLGVDAVAAVAPYFYAYGEEPLYSHYATVAEAAPAVGHYVYDNPARVGYAAGVALVTRLVAEVPNVHGVKDTGDAVGKLAGYLAANPTTQVYTGSNTTILPALLMGARGAVSALANATPELVVAIFDAWRSGDLDTARQHQLTLARLQACVAGLPYVGAVKHLVTRRGLPAGHARAPQQLLDSDQAALLDRRLDAIEELRPWLAKS